MNKKEFFSRNVILILFIFAFVIVFGVTFAANSFISFLLKTMEFNIEQRMMVASQRAADLASAEELDRYRTVEDMQNPSYQALHRKLRDFTDSTGILYAFYSRRIDNLVYYIVDNDFNEETRVGLDTLPFELDRTPWIRSAMEGRTVVSGLGNYTPGWPGIYSAYSPVFDRDGNVAAVAGVDILDDEIVFARRMVTILTVIQAAAVFTVFIAVLIFLIRFQAVRDTPPELKENSIQRKFLVFSIFFFAFICVGGSIVFMSSVRRLTENKNEQSLNLAIEGMKLRMANTVDAELRLSVKMADAPLIKKHFLDPGDPELREQALAELEAYRRNFRSGSIFWVNDIDKIFYYDGEASYAVDPGNPDNYWYNMTLYETEKYNFNINYNPDLKTTNLWVNAPVFENGKAVGIVGTGIDLTEFLNNWNTHLESGIEVYFFNAFNEITVAQDISLVLEKKDIVDHLGQAGETIVETAGRPDGPNIQIISLNNSQYAVSSLPFLNWHIAAVVSLNSGALFDPAMTTFFVILIGLVLVIFIVSNVFVASIQNMVNVQNHRLRELAAESRAASEAKSSFLATMSHEIRTPMNAIIGMSELLLRKELPGDARGDVESIKQAGSNLLSIINDILDFSKIESGKMEIIPTEYEFSSLINDVITIIRMRLREKPIYFVVNVDSAIPRKLYGDAVRVRQILLNLLSNAAKYTHQGHIIFTVDIEERGEESLTLKFEIADTGIGIRREDLGKLFGNFSRLDSRSNQGVEGTGLGLTITRSLCRAMGGDVAAQSEYGEGSTFTAWIPQGIGDKAPFALAADPEAKKVLIYETREVYGNSIVCSVDNLGVSCKLAADSESFTEALETDRFDFIFAASFLFDEAREKILKRGIDTTLVLLAEYGEVIAERQARFIAMPAYSISIANILNGVEELRSYSEDDPGIRFTAPDARVLVVDDIKTNLDVAEGLLAPYAMRVDSCLNGKEAVKLVQENSYDLVLMDHMMPGMDGIETVNVIRALPGGSFQRLPVVVLTANAIAGMRDMFLETGFNDYISKPIEIVKLDEVIAKWIPAEKQIKAGRGIKRDSGKTAILIPGVDTQKGIGMTGGTEAGYRKVLAQFYKDASERLPVFTALPSTETALTAFVTQAHAIKSAAGTIGAAEVSKEAAALEAAGKAGDTAAIREGFPGFYEHLAKLIEEIGKALDGKRKDRGGGAQNGGRDPEAVITLAAALQAALEAKSMRAIDRLLAELEENSPDKTTTEAVNTVSDLVLMGRFEDAVDLTKKLFALRV